jgi:iron complex outermembrane receptor protein
VDIEASPQNTFTLQGDLYSGDENVPAGGKDRVSGGNVLGRWSHTFSEDSDMSLKMNYDRTNLNQTTASNVFAPAGNFMDDLDTYDVDFQHRFRLGSRNRVIWGLGYRFTHDVVQPAPTLTFLPTHLEHHLFSGFLQDEIKVWDTVFLTLGTKLEHNDYTGLEVEPSARIKWNPTDKQMVWAAVSRAVRTPSRIDRELFQPTYLPQPFPQSFLRGDSDFVSETLIAYELGYRAQLHPRVSVSLSTFYNEYDHIRSTSTTPTSVFPFFFENNLEGETYGGELAVDYQILDWWRLHAGYNLLKENLRVKDGRTDLNDALNETADPKHQFSFRSSMDLPYRVELDGALRWVDTLHNNLGPTVGTVPSYFELDVRLGWHATDRLEFSIVGQNLLHDQHPEYGFPSSSRVEIARSVYGKVTWRW